MQKNKCNKLILDHIRRKKFDNKSYFYYSTNNFDLDLRVRTSNLHTLSISLI